VDLRRILDYHHVFALEAAIAHFCNRGIGIAQQPLLVRRICPRPRHHPCAISNLVFVSVDQRIQRRPIHQPLFYQQRFQCLHSQRRV
jgi:hypothetical protein